MKAIAGTAELRCRDNWGRRISPSAQTPKVMSKESVPGEMREMVAAVHPKIDL